VSHSYSSAWSAMLDRTAAAATERFRVTGSRQLYLWRHEDGGRGLAALRWHPSIEPPAPGYEPVTPEPLSEDVPVSRYPLWLDQRLRRCCAAEAGR
jgi:hypothetical protein